MCIATQQQQSPAPPPPAPKRPAADVEQVTADRQAELQAIRAATRRGNRETILTGPLGVPISEAAPRRSSILGG